MSAQKPTPRELLTAARQLGIVVLVVDGDLVIHHAPPAAYATLWRRRKSITRQILEGKTA